VNEENNEILVWQASDLRLVERFIGAPGQIIDIMLLDKEKCLCAFLDTGEVVCFRTSAAEFDEQDRNDVMAQLQMTHLA